MSMPLDRHAHEFGRFEVGHNDDLFAHQFFGGVAAGDAGDDGSLFAQVHFQLKQFSGPGTAWAETTVATRRSILAKSSMLISGLMGLPFCPIRYFDGLLSFLSRSMRGNRDTDFLSCTPGAIPLHVTSRSSL
jgi:hypothetical protein